MATTELTDVIYQGNKRTQAFAVKDSDGVAFDLTAYSTRWALSAIDAATGLVSATAEVTKSDATASEMVVTDAANGLVEVYMLGVDTSALLGNYHFELEIVADADSESIVVAEGTLEIRRNVDNS